VRWSAFGAAFVAAVVVISACTSAPTFSSYNTDLLDAPTCAEDSDACNVDDECCSSLCTGGVCAISSVIVGPNTTPCIEDNGMCDGAGDEDCCSLVCNPDGFCGVANGFTCSTDGASCAEASDCCSHVCSGGTCGAPTGSCLIANSACAHGSDCCSNDCDPTRYLCSP